MSEEKFNVDGDGAFGQEGGQEIPEEDNAPKVSLEKPRQDIYKEAEPLRQGEYQQTDGQFQNQTGGQWQNQADGQGSQWQGQSGQYAGYAQGVSGGQVAYQPQNQGFGIASMIIGILSLVFFCSCINIPLAIISIVFGIVQLSKQGSKRWMAVTGIVTSVASLILFVVFIIAIILSPDFQDAFWDSYNRNMQQNFGDDYSSDFYPDLYDRDDDDTF